MNKNEIGFTLNLVGTLLTIAFLGICGILMFFAIIIMSLYEPIKLITQNIASNWE